MDMLNPIAPIRSSIRYTQTTLSTPQSYTQVGLDATLFMPPQLGVLIIGESARAQNFEYNGYNRPTNPFSKSYDLINFSNFTSCGVITAISVPCMLTNLTHKTYTARNLSHYRDNILDIAKRVGFSVYFLSNNGGDCIGAVCKRLDSDKIIYYNNKHLDGDMLEMDRMGRNTICAIRKNSSFLLPFAHRAISKNAPEKAYLMPMTTHCATRISSSHKS